MSSPPCVNLTRRLGSGCLATVSGARANASRLSKHLQFHFDVLPRRFFLLPPCGPFSWPWRLCLGRGSGGAPFCFSLFFFPPFFRLVRVALGCRQPVGAEMAVIVLAQDWLVFILCASNSVEVSTCRSTKTFKSKVCDLLPPSTPPLEQTTARAW